MRLRLAVVDVTFVALIELEYKRVSWTDAIQKVGGFSTEFDHDHGEVGVKPIFDEVDAAVAADVHETFYKSQIWSGLLWSQNS